MPASQNPDQVLGPVTSVKEILQGLLVPDSTIDSWSSEARKALQECLKLAATQSSCNGVYWLDEKDNPDEIVVVSRCRLQIEDASSRPYIAELRSLGSSATAKSSTASDFSTIFFPAADCDGESKKEVTTDGASEVSDEVSFSFGDVESLRNPTPGWISETRDIERQDFNGIVCRLKRHNTPSDESFKATNLHWKTLVEGLMARSVGEKENQAKVLQTVRKPYRLKYDSEDDDGVHEEIDMELEKLSSGASRLRKLAEATAESGLPCDHITCRGCLRNLKRLISRKRLEWIR